MLTVAHHYDELLTLGSRTYRARVYGDQRADGRWAGSVIFAPVGGGRLIATGTETTQSTLADLARWGSGLSEVYLEGALARALALQPEAELARELERLEQLEVSAGVRAAALESAADMARTESWVAEAARARTEERLYETIAENAEGEAEEHEQAAAESHGAAEAAERILATKKRQISPNKRKANKRRA